MIKKQSLDKNLDKNIVQEDVSSDSEGYRRELQKGLIDIETKNSALNSMEIINDNKIKDEKLKFLRMVLDKMIEFGVDINDISSINKFLTEIERNNPDMRELFEEALNTLLNSIEGVDDSTGNVMNADMPIEKNNREEELPPSENLFGGENGGMI